MEQPPIITVIILCYNQQAYVKQAIASVYSQKNIDIQVIVCDDFSTDTSKQTIRSLKQIYDFELVENESNLGNCKSFNNCLSLAKGKYVIDLAADDYLIENSLLYRIQHFEKQGDNVGFTYSDAVYVKQDSHFLFDHSIHCGLMTFPEGAIFQRLFEGKFICPPTVIFKTNVLRSLNGYDENLSYEDFDIWLRIARNHSVAYTPQKSVVKRVVAGSLSSRFYEKNSSHLLSTLVVCNKAIKLSKVGERLSISKFILYHFRLAYFTQNYEVAQQFYSLAKQITEIDNINGFLKFLLDKKINIHLLYKIYLKFKLSDSIIK